MRQERRGVYYFANEESGGADPFVDIDEGEGEDELKENENAAGLTRSSRPRRLFDLMHDFPHTRGSISSWSPYTLLARLKICRVKSLVLSKVRQCAQSHHLSEKIISVNLDMYILGIGVMSIWILRVMNRVRAPVVHYCSIVEVSLIPRYLL